MQLNKIDDPRDALAKLSRKECEYWARYKGIDEIDPRMSKDLMVRILRKHGVQAKSITERGLGQHRRNTPAYDDWLRVVNGESPVVQPETAVEESREVTADDILMAQWEAEKARSGIPLNELPITELRKMCKAKGIVMQRTDKKPDLIGKLNGHAS